MKIICIGRNYAEHAKELGNDVPTEPVFFCKPDSAILPKGNPFFIPAWTDDIHYEVEIVIRINRLGKFIAEEFADRYYNEVGLGIDFTARKVQDELKKKGLPWEKAKAFDGSAVISHDLLPVESVNFNNGVKFQLYRNDVLVQNGHSGDMIFNIPKIISCVSQYMTLKIGDYIFTGTPSGVGKVERGDSLRGVLEGKEMFDIRVR